MEEIMDRMGNLRRSIYAGELRDSNIDETVTLMGWVARSRNLGALIFADIRDIKGIAQVVFDGEDKELFEKAGSLRAEYVVAIKGVVRERSSKNAELPTGDVEVLAYELKILDTANTPPIYIKDDDNVAEEMRLKYKYLDLRKPKLQKTLMTRSKIYNIVRNFYYENGFTEVETPILGKSTPEGAHDYLVPSRVHPGEFYALPQSPQIYKQLLMIAGMDRYFQIAKCFRDEDLRANRQPEFTQIDVEMSFVDVEDVLGIHEKLITRLFKEILNKDIEVPFRRMKFDEAMDRYGVDKPDLRFGMELTDLTDIVKDVDFNVFKSAVEAGGVIKGICVSGGNDAISKKKQKKLEDFVKDYRAKGLINLRYDDEMTSSIDKFIDADIKKKIFEKFHAKKGDMVFIIADKYEVVSQALGALRNNLARELDLIDEDDYKILWIVDFPLFEYDEEENRYVAKHHPFTSPRDEDVDKMLTDPAHCYAKAYDLVINGEELGGGSIRINNSEIQDKMFEAIGFTKEDAHKQFGFFIEALSYGTPPHGGIAFGVERMIQMFTKTSNIRDVIAFPKTQSATDLMSSAPSAISDLQLKEVSLKVDIPSKKDE